MQNLVIQARKP